MAKNYIITYQDGHEMGWEMLRLKELRESNCVGLLISVLDKRTLLHELHYHKDDIKKVVVQPDADVDFSRPIDTEQAIEEIQEDMSYLEDQMMDKCQCICKLPEPSLSP